MATNTYVALQTTTLGTAASSYTFTSIPAGYTDLVLVGSALTSTTGYSMTFGVNGDTGTNYSETIMSGSGTAAQSARYSNISNTETYIGGWVGGYTSGTPTTFVMNFQNYSNTTTYKTVLSRSSAPSKSVEAVVALWRNTAAITSITIYAQSGSTIAAGSTFSLYGILAEGGAKATGGYVTSDANYYYHTFLASGTFTPKSTLSCDYLVVAGGAGGATAYGGGGGAGGLRSTVTATGGGGSLETALSVSTAVTVTVGAGGAVATNGSNSVFSTITSTGGGKGGTGPATNSGSTGGSGGGGGARTGTAGAGTANQGYAGGSAVYSPTYVSTSSAGGGGAGAVGGNAVNVAQSTAGAGGIGVAISALATATNTGVSNYYAGGGGGAGRNDDLQPGGAGGLGGGGKGSGSNGVSIAATANTGGGGGGADNANVASAGGSGIVIVRYAKV